MDSTAGIRQGRARWIVVFIFVLLASSVVPVLAAEPQITPVRSGESITPTPGLDEIQIPGPEDVRAGIEAAEREEEEREAWLRSPAAKTEREQSRLAFADLGSAPASEILNSVFGKQLEQLNTDPARALGETQLLTVRDETDATVEEDGDAKVLESSMPLRAVDEGGDLAKVDLGLEATAKGFETTNALVDVAIPSSAKGPVEVGDRGISIRLVGADEERTLEPFGAQNALASEVLTDTDMLVSPIASGVEIFNLLRSEHSPETVRFLVGMPSGAELRPDAAGGAEVVKEGELLTTIREPVAIDAQGTQVPVGLQIEEDSILLTVEHREGNYAMPILLDPILENNESWIYGQNWNALHESIWAFNKNVAGIHGSTYCIYHCFGISGARGLFVSGQSGTYWPNQYGQWVYTAPNQHSYISSATFHPFVRYDHGCNAATTQYKQPHDYVGLWNGSSWTMIHTNAANHPAGGPSVWGGGQLAVAGLSSGATSFSIPCWRDVYVQGAHVWLDDWARPSLSASSSGQWMDTSSVRLNVSASDAGLGVQAFEAVATNSSGSEQTWWTEHSCTGTRRSRCPNTWNLGNTAQPKLNYSPSALPEGIRDLTVTAYDAVEKPSLTQAKMTVRVDHTAPTISLSGSLTQQASLGTELASYKLKIEAKDGVAGSSDPVKARSGVASLIVESDGELIDSYAPGCATQSCAINEELELRASLLPPGEHDLVVKATDALGHTATKQLGFATEDNHEPELEVSGMPAEEPGMPWGASFQDDFGSAGPGDGQFSHPADAAVDREGSLWVLDRWNQRVQKFNWKGEYLDQFGSYGSGDGEFKGPSAIDTDPDGNVWITDSGNDRVQKFSPEGEYLSQFGTHGISEGEFDEPAGIAVAPDGDVIYVIDRGNNRIEGFGKGGEYLGQKGSYGWEDAQFDEPTGIAIGGPWGEHPFTVIVVDSGNNRVQRLSPGGEFLGKFGSFGIGDGQFNSPGSINVDTAGNVWIGDRKNGRVQGFSEDGEYLTQFGVPGAGSGQFDFVYPMGITGNPNGSLWVTDAGNNRVQRWSIPKSTVSGYLEPISAAATDSGGYGVTSLKVTLTNSAQNTEVLDEATQVCFEGACPLDLELDEIDLSEKPSGHYTLKVVATDAAGNMTSRSRAIYLDSTPPEVELSGSLAESAGQPLPSSSAVLDITATEADSASVGIERINVERDGQIVATHLADCAADCDELEASYLYRANDGADRQIRQVAESGEGAVGGLASASCAAFDDCWATGRTMHTVAEQEEGKISAALLEHWDGEEWQAVAVPKPAEANDVALEDVSCESPSFCRAAGSFDIGSARRPLVELGNDGSWGALAGYVPFGAPGALLTEISCGDAANTSCWFAGATEITPAEQAEGKAPISYLQRWTGTTWETVATPTPAGAGGTSIQDLSCTSSSSCQAVGHAVAGTVQSPIATSWGGTQWSVDELPLPDGISGGSLVSVSCPGAEACWAAGMSQPTTAEAAEGVVPSPFFERWDGSDWTALAAPEVPDSVAANVSGVSCGTVSACTAVGSYENIYSETRPLAYTWGEDEWRYQPMPTRPEAAVGLLEGVSCTGANECAMVGYAEAESGERTVLAEAEAPGQGPHTVTVEAVDAQGNSASKSIEVDVPEKVVDTPECDPEATTMEAKGVLSAGEATEAVEESLPEAVAPSEEMIQETTEVEVDPSYSAPQPDLETEDSLVEGETSVDSEAGFAIGDVACVTPVETTTAATDATVVNEDTALFANTAPETDTVVRPTAGGTTVVQNLRGPDAPNSFSWKIELGSGQELEELPSGAIAIVEDPPEGEEIEEGTEPDQPEEAETPAVLNDAGVQLETAEYALASAQAETSQEVIAVVPSPWVVLSQEVVVPAKIEVAPVEYIPLVWELEVTIPQAELEEAVYPVGLTMEFLSSFAANGHCARKYGSPCGAPDLGRAARYAVYWGNEKHHFARKPYYHDYKSNDCTNFVSQILRAGGMRFMRFKKKDGERRWWYYNFSNGMFSPPDSGYDNTPSWSVADVLPRFLWRFGLARIDPVQQPWGWTKGNIISMDWFGSNGKGDINHVMFVVGTRHFPGRGREPLLANHSTISYPNKPWAAVRARIQEQEKVHGWGRFALAFKHTNASPKAQKYEPWKLYGSSGLYGH